MLTFIRRLMATRSAKQNRVEAILGRMNVQLGMQIVLLDKLVQVWDAAPADPDEGLLTTMADSDGTLSPESSLIGRLIKQSKPVAEPVVEVEPAIHILDRPLKSNGRLTYRESLQRATRRSGLSIDTLQRCYISLTDQEVHDLVDGGMAEGWLKTAERRTTVRGVSAVRSVYRHVDLDDVLQDSGTSRSVRQDGV